MVVLAVLDVHKLVVLFAVVADLLHQALGIELDLAVLLAQGGGPDVLGLDRLLDQVVTVQVGPVGRVDANEVADLWSVLDWDAEVAVH